MRRTVLTVAGAGTLAIGAGSILAGRSQADDVEQYQLRLKTALGKTAERAEQAGQAVMALLRAVTDSFSGLPVSEGRLALSAARQAAIFAEDPSRRELMVVTGGRRLMDWLLSAASGEGRPAQLDATRALQHLLATPSTAAALLARPGAVPRLLALAGSGGEGGMLVASLQAAGPAVRLPPVALLDDLASTLRLASGHAGSGQVQALAVAFLASWAEASVTNCGKIAALGGGRALARTAARAAREGPNRDLMDQLFRVFGVLARDCPLRGRLSMGAWVEPLLYAAAEAAATRDWPLAARALDAFSFCVSHGARLEEAPGMQSVHALLKRLTGEPDELLRRSVLTAVAALAQPGSAAGELPEALRDYWAELALRWACADDTGEELRFGCAGALAALAAASGDAGWRVACGWLGDLLVHLSRQVTAYHAVRKTRAPVGVAEEVYASAVAVLPVYARAVAAELRATSERAPPWQEPPPTMDDLLAPAAAQPAVDAALADAVLAKALTVTCALVAADDAKQRWLRSAGILPLLHRLTIGRAPASAEAGSDIGAALATDDALSLGRLVLRDGVHLFCPGASHHRVLARHGAAAACEDAPALDVVFVHGLRGGPFATWRHEREGGRGAVGHGACWPTFAEGMLLSPVSKMLVVLEESAFASAATPWW
ncbi:hypothetical protein WJX81_006810 [Elliptochloris bilobata]|uniref:Uncharacterized protein n=1 Tax=Elliptochloris bilobata TaxID=381761 RepID=A0AAW1QLK6_9CHLO